jgi:transcriptional regulator GlxA family with amidase domain
MEGVLKDKNVIDFIKKTSQSASWMASNCSGAALLAQAGVLDGKRATTWCGGEKQLAASYPKG